MGFALPLCLQPVDSASSVSGRGLGPQQQQHQEHAQVQQQVIPYVKPLNALHRSNSIADRKPSTNGSLQPPSPCTLLPHSGPNSAEQHSSSLSGQLQALLQISPASGPQLNPPLGTDSYMAEDPGVQVLLEAGGDVSYQPMPAIATPSSGFRSSGYQGSISGQEMESWLIQEYCDLGTLSDAVQEWQAEGRKQFMVSIDKRAVWCKRLIVEQWLLRKVATFLCSCWL